MLTQIRFGTVAAALAMAFSVTSANAAVITEYTNGSTDGYGKHDLDDCEQFGSSNQYRWSCYGHTSRYER